MITPSEGIAVEEECVPLAALRHVVHWDLASPNLVNLI